MTLNRADWLHLLINTSQRFSFVVGWHTESVIYVGRQDLDKLHLIRPGIKFLCHEVQVRSLFF